MKNIVNPTFLGLFSILTWGIAVPFMRMISDQIGIAAYVGTIFTCVAILGLIRNKIRGSLFPDKAVLRNRFFYGRWLFFAVHTIFLSIGISIVQKEHVPFVILLNYLWPTAIIFFSILLAGVHVTRLWALLLGSAIVISSLAFEILGPSALSEGMFINPMDCVAYALVFCGALSWGVYSALSRRAGEETGGSSVLPFFQLTVGLFLPLSFLPGMSSWEGISTYGPYMMAGFVCMQFLAFLAWDNGMRRGNVVILSLCADTIPWLSLAATSFLLNMEIGQGTIISSICLVMGAVVTRYGILQKKAD